MSSPASAIDLSPSQKSLGELIAAGKTFKQTDMELEGMNYLVEGVVGKAA